MIVANAALGICTGAAALIVGEALWAYPRLPARVPLQFGLDGKPRRMGPRAAFAAVFIVLAIATCAEAFATLATSGAGARASDATLVTLAAATAFAAYCQHAIVATVLRGDLRLPMPQFWVGLAIFIAVTAFAR